MYKTSHTCGCLFARCAAFHVQTICLPRLPPTNTTLLMIVLRLCVRCVLCVFTVCGILGTCGCQERMVNAGDGDVLSGPETITIFAVGLARKSPAMLRPPNAGHTEPHCVERACVPLMPEMDAICNFIRVYLVTI